MPQDDSDGEVTGFLRAITITVLVGASALNSAGKCTRKKTDPIGQASPEWHIARQDLLLTGKMVQPAISDGP